MAIFAPWFGYIFCAILAALAWFETDADVKTQHYINAVIGLVFWTFAFAWPIAAASTVTVILIINLTIIAWASRTPPMATR
jgi:hypothetical protein